MCKKIKEKPILLLFFDFLVKLFKGLDAYVGVRNNLGTVGKKLVIFYLETSIKKKTAVGIKILEKLTHLLLRKGRSLNQTGRYSILWEPLAIQACIKCVSEHDDETV